jgi:hypothetical protein
MKIIHYLTILCGAGSIGLIFPLLDQQTEIFNKLFIISLGIISIIFVSKSVTKV